MITVKRAKFFKLLDVIILFNVFTFLGGGIISLKTDSISLPIVFFVVTALNIGYLAHTIYTRAQNIKLKEEQEMIEAQVEQELEKENIIDINYVKQVILERRIETEIKNSFPESMVIKNAYIPRNDGSYSEIDLIAVSTKGIFIIESKNITGEIRGSWKEDVLKIHHPSGTIYDLQNPIEQNTKHFYAVKNILGLNHNYFRNIVVFGDNSYIGDYKDVPFYSQVCKVHTLARAMNRLAARQKTIIEAHQVENFYNLLVEFASKTTEKEVEHIKRIEEQREKEEA